MKTYFIFLLLIILLNVACERPKEELPAQEIKENILRMYAHHVDDLKNLDHDELMEHYANIDDHILFGDGEYWGNYDAVNDIWKGFIANSKEIITWNLSNNKIHILSNKSASYLMEFYSERITIDGDTAKVKGSAAYGLKKIGKDWKIVTTNVTHYVVEN
jgi:ketosteroid isomerase-like protein